MSSLANPPSQGLAKTKLGREKNNKKDKRNFKKNMYIDFFKKNNILCE